MKNQELKSSLMLLLAAAIWGFAFVAQRVGAQFVGAFTFNGLRFALGSLSLLPLILYLDKKPKEEVNSDNTFKNALKPGVMAGCVLFLGAALQQSGLSYTTAGKAAFLTGLYIVLVPVFGIFLKQHVRINTWIAVVLAIAGLYFLSITESFTIAKGDLLEIIGAIFWALHILLIDNFTKKVDALKLSMIQFATCSILSLTTAIIFETISFSGVSQAFVPILYGGLLSVGVAYTLQVIGQKHAKPSHAAIILSMETVFAAIGGILMLGEDFGARGYLGCALMMSGMLLSQVQGFGKKEAKEVSQG